MSAWARHKSSRLCWDMCTAFGAGPPMAAVRAGGARRCTLPLAPAAPPGSAPSGQSSPWVRQRHARARLARAVVGGPPQARHGGRAVTARVLHGLRQRMGPAPTAPEEARDMPKAVCTTLSFSLITLGRPELGLPPRPVGWLQAPGWTPWHTPVVPCHLSPEPRCAWWTPRRLPAPEGPSRPPRACSCPELRPEEG